MDNLSRRTSDVLAAIVGVITPYVGHTMARAAAEAHCRKLGVSGEQIAAEQLDALIARIGAGLNIFVGREKTAGILADMRRAVERLAAS
jgi:hypothetical protein